MTACVEVKVACVAPSSSRRQRHCGGGEAVPRKPKMTRACFWEEVSVGVTRSVERGQVTVAAVAGGMLSM